MGAEITQFVLAGSFNKRALRESGTTERRIMPRARSVSWGGDSSTTIGEIDRRLQLCQNTQRRKRPLRSARCPSDTSSPSFSREESPRQLPTYEAQTRSQLESVEGQRPRQRESKLESQSPRQRELQSQSQRESQLDGQRPRQRESRSTSGPHELTTEMLSQRLSSFNFSDRFSSARREYVLTHPATRASAATVSPFSSPGSIASSAGSQMSFSSSSSEGSSLQSSTSGSPADETLEADMPGFDLSCQMLLGSPMIPLHPAAEPNVPKAPARLWGVARTRSEETLRTSPPLSVKRDKMSWIHRQLHATSNQSGHPEMTPARADKPVQDRQGWKMPPPPPEFEANGFSSIQPNLSFSTSHHSRVVDEAKLFDQRWRLSERY